MKFSELDGFTQAYVECMFFTESHADNPELESKGFEDLAENTLGAIAHDCDRFQREYADELAAVAEANGNPGHDFWLTRNGHGAGFWDGGYPAPYGDKLTAAAKGFGESNLYLGDDGKLYLS